MPIYLEKRKRGQEGIEASNQGSPAGDDYATQVANERSPEDLFEESVKGVIESYMQAKYPYVVKRPGFYNLDEVNMDANSAVMSYNLTNSKGDVVGSIPIIFSQGKIRKPWTIFVPKEERMLNLSERFIDKLYEVSEDYSGSPAIPYSDVADRVLYTQDYANNDITMAPHRVRAFLELLPTSVLAGIVKRSRKDASIYYRVGRMATKVASSRLLKPVRRAAIKETFTVKKGGLLVSSTEELSRVNAPKKNKRSALNSLYAGDEYSFVAGDENIGELLEITPDGPKDFDFEIIDPIKELAKQRNIIVPGVHRETGESIFLLKCYTTYEDTNFESTDRDIDVSTAWNKGIHGINAVAYHDWKDKYIEHIEEIREKGRGIDDVMSKLIERKPVKIGNGKSTLFLLPADPDEAKSGDFNQCFILKHFESDADGDIFLDFVYGDISAADFKSCEDGEIRTRFGQSYYIVKVDDVDRNLDQAYKKMREEHGFYPLGDSPFSGAASVNSAMEHNGELRSCMADMLSLDEMAKTTMWMKKKGELFVIGIAEHRKNNIVEPIPLARNITRKQAAFVIGMSGGDPAAILKGDWSKQRKFLTTSPAIKKMAEYQDPAILEKIMGTLTSQADFNEDAGGKVNINIENLTLTMPDLTGFAKEQTSEPQDAPELPEEQAPEQPQESGDLYDELREAGIEEEVIEELKTISTEYDIQDAEMVEMILGYIEEETGKGNDINYVNANVINDLTQALEGTRKDTEGSGGETPEGQPEGQPEDQGQYPPVETIIEMLYEVGVTDETIQLMNGLPEVTGMSIEEVYISAGQYAEEAMEQGVSADKINADIQENAQQLLNSSSEELGQAANMPDEEAGSRAPLPPEQEQAMVGAGDQVAGAVPQSQEMATPMYDQTTHAAAQPGMEQYTGEMESIREGSLLADIISNATIKTKFLDYLPTLNNTIDAISELILKVELSRNQLIDEVGTSNLDSVSENLRRIADLLGNLVLKIVSFK